MSEPARALPDDDRPAGFAAGGEGPSFPDPQVSAERSGPEGPAGIAPMKLTTSHDLSSAVEMQRPTVPPRPVPGAPGAPPAAEASPGPKPWTAAASSVPRVRVAPAGPAPADEPDPDAGPWRPEPARATRGARHEADDDRGDEAGLGADEFPDDAPTRAPSPPPPLHEPWWVVALESLRGNPRVQGAVVACVLVPLLAWMFWPRSEPGLALHDLKREPLRWDGQVVRVEGRVGEVFHVGAGWAFNLHQGRDTIVVFTRGPAPRTRDRISLAGSVSTGFLDGQPRLAIFAEPASR